MAGGTIRAIALVLCLAAAPAAGSQIVDPASARRAITNPAVATAETRLAALAQDGKTSEISRSLDQIAADLSLDATAREYLLDRGLHRLATLAPTVEARATVDRLARRRPVIHTRVDPDHGDRTTPLYDVGATARFVLRSWSRTAARDQAQADLRGGRSAAVDRFAALANAAPRDPARTGIADAFRAAPPRELALQRAAIVSAIAAGRRVDELALALAQRLADRELLELVIGHADAPVALAAVGAIGNTFDRQTAVELLAVASRRAEIASAAVLAVGRLAGNDGFARAFLFETLEDPDLGSSAAAALGALGDPAVTAELGRRLRASRTETSRRLFVLALRLDANAGAREELRRFAETRKGSAQLQREVQQWLAP